MGKTAVDMALAAYGLAWKGILPLLKFNTRLKEGWAQRTLSEGMPAPAHLWIQAASGGEAYLHDGRARNLNEAILWHGGEAEASKQNYAGMTQSEKDALITFLKSL